MPVTCGKDSEGCYCRYGEQKKYRYECGDTDGHARAKAKAERQGRAIRANQEDDE